MKMNKYDAGKDVYYEIDIDKLPKELKSYNFDQTVVDGQVNKAIKKVEKQVAKLLGVKAANVTLTVDGDTITIVATKGAEKEPAPKEGA